jgi:ketosteroid isomerase-like protein
MRGFLALAGLAWCVLAFPAAATVAPPTPEQRAMMAKRDWLENAAREQVGNEVVERARDWRRSWGAILVGDERAGAPPRLLIKDEYGWYEIAAGRTQRLPLPVGHELNRLLMQEALWLERPYDKARPCRRAARLFILRHAGQEQFGRQLCRPAGLAGRAAEVAATLRVPKAPAVSTAPLPTEPPPTGLPPGQYQLTQHIFRRLSDMAAAWERKILPGFVDNYAEDVIVERPEGVLRGRKAVVDWARYLQDWSGPLDFRSPRTLHHASMPPVQGDAFYETHELRWEEEGRPLRQTFSALWRNNGGLWQIVHEKVGPVKPATERQPR